MVSLFRASTLRPKPGNPIWARGEDVNKDSMRKYRGVSHHGISKIFEFEQLEDFLDVGILVLFRNMVWLSKVG